MKNQIQSVPIGRLAGNPDSPNRMGKSKFNKLVHNIERTSLYEPLIVRPLKRQHPHPHPDKRHLDEAATRSLEERKQMGGSLKAGGFGDGISCESQKAGDVIQSDRGLEARDTEAYEIINGHQRWQALQKLGFERVDVVVWDVDDRQADIFLATLNRLGGSDVLEKKLVLLKRLSERMKASELAKLLGQSARQIERLTSFALRRSHPQASLEAATQSSNVWQPHPDAVCRDGDGNATHLDDEQDEAPQCVAFFLNDEQKKLIEKAMSLAGGGEKTKAARNAAALTQMAEEFMKMEYRELHS